MPEYLSPDVYVEEVDTGSKPIEGVSTSTAGVLGVTERGPSNVPILVTSTGDYTRWFGERLDPLDFPGHCFLPHAVEGFFTNGGKRLYLTRIEAQGAARATFELGDRGGPNSAATRLLAPAPEGSGLGTAASPPLYVLDVDTPAPNALKALDRLRIGSGSETEYRDVATVGGAGTLFHVPLSLPLARAHAAPTATARDIVVKDSAAAPFAFTLAAPAATGDATVSIKAGLGDVLIGDLLEIDATAGTAQDIGEFRFVQKVDVVAPNLILTLDSPLALGHQATCAVRKRDPNPAGAINDSLIVPAAANGGVAFVATPSTNFTDRRHLVVFDAADPARREARRIGSLAVLSVEGAFDDYATGSVVAGVSVALTGTPFKLTATALAGTTAIAVADRTQFPAGTTHVMQIGVAPQLEYATVASVPNPSSIAPDPGNLILLHPLGRTYPTGTPVQPVTAPALRSDRPAAALLFDVRNGDSTIPVSDAGLAADLDRYAAKDLVRVTTPAGGVYYHTLTGAALDCQARPITVAVAVERPHPVGSEIAERAGLVAITALDTGAWGNRLRISVEDESPGLVARTPILSTIAANRLKVASLTGLEAGTVLEIVEVATGAQLETAVKVQSVDRSTGEITLDGGGGLTPTQLAVLLGALPNSFVVRSREFRLTVLLLRQPDPTLPARNGQIVNREVFRFLSMDDRHSRYVMKVVGDSAGPPRLSDHRPDGESWYVRVSDLSPSHAVRLGPEPLVDRLPDGRIEPARHPLSLGDDSLGTLNDASYIGVDNVDPDKRTGLFSLANIDDISLVACPGRTSAQIQNALIAHCEELRYRFAVLDGQGPPQDTISDVLTQRQQYDTKYAALYHPWLLVSQPFPASAATPPEFAIPPSGHVLGVFARTDIERGVHKAPANEVVRGVLGLQRTLNKQQHDILNPSPYNINVIRDFRHDSRGIRVYGGRCITSDTDWKYVNVRRLILFIERSLNIGLHWVVFEPNAEPLWARVRRSIANFLTLAWRNGALEGSRVEEAFFVRCDRHTMTQADIDSGRLICQVGVAPTKPAEFVIVRIGLWTANAAD
jgi:phage tail sheath protein FI